jgi:hypothetical protein
MKSANLISCPTLSKDEMMPLVMILKYIKILCKSATISILESDLLNILLICTELSKLIVHFN